MIDFKPNERTIIAEFIYSLQQDILIITDAIKLVKVLSNHKLLENEDAWLKRIEDKDMSVIAELKEVLTSKVGKGQGSEIMDEYYGKKPGVQEVVSDDKPQEEKEQHYRWGVGKEANSKSFDTIKLFDKDWDLIHGEFPHSRKDNTTYARSKENPKEIYEFDGHRIPFKIVIEESNYLKSSSLSGDEIRKSCSGKLFIGDQQVFECGGRTYERAYKNIDRFIDDMEQNWSWYPNKLDEWLGKIIKYEGQLFKIERFIVSQACMMLVTPDGKPRKPFASESEDVENNDFDLKTSVKVEITSDHIWWYPTKKELEAFK